MMKRNKKRLIVCLLIITLLVVGNKLFNYIIYLIPTQIELKDNTFDDPNGHILIGNDRLLWDTGASRTVLLSDFKQKKHIVGFSLSSDTHNKMQFTKLYFSKNIVLHRILIKNSVYTEIYKFNISKSIQNLNISGILGMDIICNHNWLLDFDKNIIRNFDKTCKYDALSQFKLTYFKKNIPYTNIKIENVYLKDILIDSGLNLYFLLLKSDIENINAIIEPDTVMKTNSSGLFSDSIPSKQYVYTNIKINNTVFDTLTINEGEKRLIGIGFFRKFDKVFWDSGKKEVRFYKNTRQ